MQRIDGCRSQPAQARKKKAEKRMQQWRESEQTGGGRNRRGWAGRGWGGMEEKERSRVAVGGTPDSLEERAGPWGSFMDSHSRSAPPPNPEATLKGGGGE